jgi:hypothetical protein
MRGPNSRTFITHNASGIPSSFQYTPSIFSTCPAPSAAQPPG